MNIKLPIGEKSSEIQNSESPAKRARVRILDIATDLLDASPSVYAAQAEEEALITLKAIQDSAEQARLERAAAEVQPTPVTPEASTEVHTGLTVEEIMQNIDRLHGNN